MTLHVLADIAAVLGSLLVVWLLRSLWRDYRWHARQLHQARRFQSHTWLVDQEREDRLKAAAIWRGYKR